jgi:hypothetical protein
MSIEQDSLSFLVRMGRESFLRGVTAKGEQRLRGPDHDKDAKKRVVSSHISVAGPIGPPVGGERE